MHDWHFDIVQWDITQALKIESEEHGDLLHWLQNNGYPQIAQKLQSEYAIYAFLRFECEQLRRGNLSTAEIARLSLPATDTLP